MVLKKLDKISLEKILYISPVKFEQLEQRHQLFASLLAESGRTVFFAEPPESAFFGMKRKIVAERLIALKTSIPFKASNFPVLQKFASRLYFKLLLKKIGEHSEDLVLWTANPVFSLGSAEYKWKAQIYDKCDLHGLFPGQNREAFKLYDETLFLLSDRIIVSHPFIGSSMPERYKNKIELVPNRPSREFLNTPVTTSPPDDGKTHFLSTGAHFEWIDFDWLKMIAQRPNSVLHIAGSGRGKDFESLIKMPGVVWHGRLSQSDLAHLCDSCHVGLVPFKDMPLIKGVDPIKAKEYKARGLKVLAPFCGDGW